jgi:crotonobetainyl-CoA:carnitine CoA-transferase CaiB-like acyl-CoA transferase
VSVLDGMRVIDLSQGAAGPTATAILGDHGATIVKLEPRGGEWGRTLGPPYWHGTATAAMAMNRNKRSLALDIRKPEGREIVRRLLASADVLVESFRPGVMQRLGIGYDEVRDLVPGLIYCSVSAFGPTGPRRDQPGVDGIVQGVSGLMSITGSPDGEPVKVGVPAADMTAALQAVQGILLALLARKGTGRGQHVEISLLDSLVSFQLIPLTMYLQTREVPARSGSGAAYTTPNEAYQTRDGAIMLAAYTPTRWRAFCQTIERPELVDDERFATNSTRMSNRALLRDEVERTMVTQDTDTWVALLQEQDIMCTPVVDYEQLVADPQLQENEMLVELPHPRGSISSVGVPIKLSETPGAVRTAGPLIGEHSRELLNEAGYTASEIDGLLKRGVVAADPDPPSEHQQTTPTKRA